MKLTVAEAELARAGTFVRVDLGRRVTSGDGSSFRSVFVAHVGGTFVAYANVCRHQPIPLDIPDGAVDLASGLRVAPMADDRIHLMCASHGALYRPSDGFCTTGPCFGQRLVSIEVALDDAGDVSLVLPDPAGGKLA